MELTIVNPHPKYPRVGLIEPPPTGYLLLAASVEPTAGRTPFPRRGPRKAALLTEPKALDAVAASPEYQKLHDAIAAAAREEYLMSARCLRRVGDVDKSRPGLFLFNYFVAEDPAVALDLWDHLAAWYAAETGMDNSTLLGPVGPGDYVFVNHARWDMSLPRFAVKQFGKRTFYSYVLANLYANRTASMPILYRLA